MSASAWRTTAEIGRELPPEVVLCRHTGGGLLDSDGCRRLPGLVVRDIFGRTSEHHESRGVVLRSACRHLNKFYTGLHVLFSRVVLRSAEG
mmetsp:Transcript_52442/g.148509  ORF Transcript_52442/g.148509 Transcript_52442/m.148509 type:complete len:91 (+) Transcript_52442:597-869(+)